MARQEAEIFSDVMIIVCMVFSLLVVAQEIYFVVGSCKDSDEGERTSVVLKKSKRNCARQLTGTGQ